MKLFQCQNCGQVLYFENVSCLHCGHALGYLPGPDRMAAVEPEEALWRVLPAAGGGTPDPQRWRFCRNWEVSACNWMVPVDPISGESADYCLACQHNRTVPDLSDPENLTRWQKIEVAKRRLFYTLLRLGLPRALPGGEHPEPLVFDFLADDPGEAKRVMTGHAEGVVTISLTEADDAARERMRSEMGEAYRTLLGHFRHEIGHYYWDILVRDGGVLDSFRALFGDERQDYGEALDRHYREGPPAGWQETHVSAYATTHPWEDWAETWAHYLHMVDTLETAAALGMEMAPQVDEDRDLTADIDLDPYTVGDADALVAAWVPLTVALNTLNRSMGQADLYPFALTDPVRRKIGYVHDLIMASRAGGRRPKPTPTERNAP